MADQTALDDFPREDLLNLLHVAEAMFATSRDRRNLLVGLGLTAEMGEQQQGAAARPGLSGQDRESLRALVESERQPSQDTSQDGSVLAVRARGDENFAGPPKSVIARRDPPRRDAARTGPVVELAEPESGARQPSAARFASELVDLLAHPAYADTAVTLARRAIRELGGDATERWADLLDTLEVLQRRHQPVELDLGTRSEWIDFKILHQYSLTDRFFGRQDSLDQLDEWATTGTSDAVRCICALGGGGKSALAWQWVSKSVPTLQHLGYQGAFWCSFYEKDFNFDEFLRRALAFCGQLDDADVDTMPRAVVEARLIEALEKGRFMLVLDGLERLMNGYAAIADRAVDPEGLQATEQAADVTRSDRMMVDTRDGAFLVKLTGLTVSRVLITTRLAPADLEQWEEDGSSGMPLPHVVFTELSGLRPEDAAALWKSIVPDDDIAEDLEAVFHFCGFHPLVISILARSVAHAGVTWPEWRQMEPHRDFQVDQNASEAAVRSYVIGVCMRDLSERSYDLLGFLTSTGKPMVLEDLTDLALLGSEVSGNGRWTEPEQVVRQLSTLLDLGMIGKATPRDGVTEYDAHPVVRAQVWELLTDPNRERFLEHAFSGLAAVPDRRVPGVDELGNHIAIYNLLVRSHQLDRAWELFSRYLWPPLRQHNENLKLRGLITQLMPEKNVLELLPLRSRRAQADAARSLGDLLLEAGASDDSDMLLRWCGAICLQIGDPMGFLYASHARAWRTLYAGQLFETEVALRQMKTQALAFSALELRATIDSWIGILLALRGEKADAEAFFNAARGITFSDRWWIQCQAEGLVYLEDFDGALRALEQLHGGPGGDEEGDAMQAAWEKLTQGMALLQAGDEVGALDALSAANVSAKRAEYVVIQCFALPCIAEIELANGAVARAEEALAIYRKLDPHNRFVLSATHAERVLARCHLKRGDIAGARAHAESAYTLAACDGPPFVYDASLRRALQVLDECGAYVPATQSTLEPQWRELLSHLEEDESRLIEAIRRVEFARATADMPDDEALRKVALARAQIISQAEPADRDWWHGITAGHAAVREILTDELVQLQTDLATFRAAFDASPHKSIAVVFRELAAKRVIGTSHHPMQVRGLDTGATTRWLAGSDAHVTALHDFMETEHALRMAHPFLASGFEEEDVAAFLADHKRRIAVADDELGREWWDMLEEASEPLHMLVLAASVLREQATLAEVVSEIAVDADHLTLSRGLTYGFQALLTRREIERLESRRISRTEGLGRLEVLLRLQDVKLQLGWVETTDETRDFWTEIEQTNESQPERVLRLAEELARRRATLSEFHDGYLESPTDNIQASLAYLDYRRLRGETWDGSQPWPEDVVSERWAYESAPPTFTDTSDLSSNQVSGRITILQNRVGWDEESETVQAWWREVVENVAPEVALRALEEVDARRAKLSHLRNGHIDGATDNLVAGVAYMDFTLLKLADDRLAGERADMYNRQGNALYEDGRYLEATNSYESAIKAKPAVTYYTNLAGAWEMVDDRLAVEALRQAITSLERGLERFPEAEGLRSALAATELKGRLAERGGLPNVASSRMYPMVTPVALEVAGDLIPYAEENPDTERPNLLGVLPAMRERILTDMGVKVPGARVRGNESDLTDGTYIIMLDEVPIVSGHVPLEFVFVTTPHERLSELGIEFDDAVDPATLEPGAWIAREDANQLEGESLDVVGYIIRHLEAVLRSNLAMFVGRQEIIMMLENVWSEAAKRIAEDATLLSRFVRVLKSLVGELVPIGNLEPILEIFLEATSQEWGMDVLMETIRTQPAIIPLLPANQPGTRFLQFERAQERMLRGALRPLGDEYYLALEPEVTQDLLAAVRNEVVGDEPMGILVEDPTLRRYVRSLVQLEFPRLHVLALSELADAGVTPTRLNPD